MSDEGLNKEILKLFTPAWFDGENPTDAARFLAQCTIFFRKAKITSADDKFVNALGLLDGKAGIWATPYVISLAEEKNPWADWTAFEKDFKAHFSNINDVEVAMGELTWLCRQQRNGRPVSEFTTQFENIVSRTKLSEEDKRVRYRSGLSDRLKEALATTAKDISTFAALCQTALEIGQALEEFDKEKAMSKPFFR